jgi:sulfite reductase (NADPH) flavoprotein alpha-component
MNAYNKNNPFFASIKERYSLCKPGSQKNTHHVRLDLSHSGITYQVGDSVAIFPVHDTVLVQRTLDALRLDSTKKIFDKHSNQEVDLHTFLSKKSNITEINRKIISETAERQTNLQKKEHLQFIIAEENRDVLKEYQKNREVWDFLLENQEVRFEPEELPFLLQPMIPRFYSIASSMKAVGESVDLTVSYVKYVSNGHLRLGVCSHYLCDMAPMYQATIPLYVQPSHGFNLIDQENASVIMIGPGTGIAPYRGFMQERIAKGNQGKNWLFFGEWNRAYDYFYEDFWEQLKAQGKLKVDLAFSRDQEHKIYVQHRMLEHAAELFRWIEEGAYIYVCGDAHRMAKDVDAVLHQIIQEQGNLDEQSAKNYIKKLRSEKRYRRDVY